MRKPKVIGLTGPIGAGKSEAARIFGRLGAEIIDADELALEVTSPQSPVLEKVKSLFGPEVIQGDGSLDRKALGNLVFASPERRRELEALIHPEVRRVFRRRVRDALGRIPPPPLIVAVIPLLFQAREHYPEIEVTIVISTGEELCLKRASARDASSIEEIRKRIRAQLSLKRQEALADIVIDNSRSLADLSVQIEKLYAHLISP